MFHLRSHIFRRTQAGAAFIIVMSQIFKIGNCALGNETGRKSFQCLKMFIWSRVKLVLRFPKALSRSYGKTHLRPGEENFETIRAV